VIALLVFRVNVTLVILAQIQAGATNAGLRFSILYGNQGVNTLQNRGTGKWRYAQPLTVTGVENVKGVDGAIISVTNHTSDFDALAL
jgi:hypothetical protein